MEQHTRVDEARAGEQTRALADRYGRPGRGRRRTLVITSALLAVVGLVWVGWAAWFQSTPEVQSALSTFTVRDAHSVSAKIRVTTHHAGVRASCLLRASGEDHSVVGERNLVLREPEGSVDVSVTFRTEREATAVELVGCTTPDQSRPR